MDLKEMNWDESGLKKIGPNLYTTGGTYDIDAPLDPEFLKQHEEYMRKHYGKKGDEETHTCKITSTGGLYPMTPIDPEILKQHEEELRKKYGKKEE